MRKLKISNYSKFSHDRRLLWMLGLIFPQDFANPLSLLFLGAANFTVVIVEN